MLRKLGIRTRGDGSGRVSAVLPNGSRIVGLPESEETIRGYSAVSLLLIDEAARWFRISLPGTDGPRIPRDFLEEERMAMGAAWFDQEYMCGFVDNGTSVFGRDVVEAALDDGVQPLVFN